MVAFSLLVITGFLNTHKDIIALGPIDFWSQVPWLFVILGIASILVLFIVPKAKDNSPIYFVTVFIAFVTYSVKLLFPYYIFDGLVNYDLFVHYENVQLLASSGVQLEGYLYWPNTFTLTDIFEKVTGTVFPLSTSFIAIVAQILLALSLFVFVRKFFGYREAILSVLLYNIAANFTSLVSLYNLIDTYNSFFYLFFPRRIQQ